MPVIRPIESPADDDCDDDDEPAGNVVVDGHASSSDADLTPQEQAALQREQIEYATRTFLAMCRELRELGAVKVAMGDVSAEFAAPSPVFALPIPVDEKPRRKLTREEQIEADEREYLPGG